MSDSSRRVVAAAAATQAVAWTVLALITVLIRMPLLLQQHAIDDEVNYSVVAQQLMNGGTLYADAVERRPPLTFWVYEAVFRVAGHDNWFALHCVAVAWVLLTMVALYVPAARMFGRRAGLTAALLYSVFQPWWYAGNQAFNGEVLMNLPIAVAYALCLGVDRPQAAWRPLSAGALIAIAFLLKQPAAIAIVPLALYYMTVQHHVDDRGMIGVAWLGVGCAIVLASVGGWLVARGVMSDALYWSILDHDVPHVFWNKAAEHTAAFLVVCLPMHAAAVWTLRHRDGWRIHPAERRALLWLLAVSVVGAAISGRFFPHYYIGLLPALAVLAAPAIELAQQCWSEPAIRRAAMTVSAWTVCVALATFAVQLVKASRDSGDTAAGDYIRDHSDTDARVFVWGRIPRIYLDSDRRPAARFIDTFALTGRMFGPRVDHVDTSNRIVPGAWVHLRDDFRAHPPAFVVDTQAGPDAEFPVSRFPWLAEVLRQDYVPEAYVDEGIVYRRRPIPAAAGN